MCDNKTIWISQQKNTNTEYIIYYQTFQDSDISYKTENDNDNNKDNNPNIGGFGIFECSSGSYLTALKSQSADISSSNLCINPASIYPDSYPGSQCQAKPKIYCLPFKDSTKCPQFQMTMNSMYNKIDINNDLYTKLELHDFYQCKCWYKSNDEGDTNNDQQINIILDFNENCETIQEQKRVKEIKNENEMLQYKHDQDVNIKQHKQEQEENEYEEEIEYEKNKEFTILWATLGFIIGVIVLIIIIIYSCRKQYDKRMYLTSRKYYRNAHYGDVENDNLMDEAYTDTESETEETETDSEYEDDDESGTGTDLSTELAYDDGTTTNYSESTIANNTDNTTLKVK